MRRGKGDIGALDVPATLIKGTVLSLGFAFIGFVESKLLIPLKLKFSINNSGGKDTTRCKKNPHYKEVCLLRDAQTTLEGVLV